MNIGEIDANIGLRGVPKSLQIYIDKKDKVCKILVQEENRESVKDTLFRTTVVSQFARKSR